MDDGPRTAVAVSRNGVAVLTLVRVVLKPLNILLRVYLFGLGEAGACG